MQYFGNDNYLEFEEEDMKLFNVCLKQVVKENFQKTSAEISLRDDREACTAKLILAIRDLVKSHDLFAEGDKETNPKYELIDNERYISGYKVSPKIYEAKGMSQKVLHDINEIKCDETRTNNIIEHIKSACKLFYEDVDMHSAGYYVKPKDYKGEFEKGLGKIKLSKEHLFKAVFSSKEETSFSNST